MVDNFDIVIVGGGFIGNALALLLAQTKLRIAVLESDTAARVDSRSLVLSYGSQQILAELNVWRNLKDSAIPLLRIHVSDAGHFGCLEITAQEANVPALGYVIQGHNLLQELQAQVKNFANIAIIQPAHLKNFQKTASGWQLDCTIKADAQTICSKFLIGADGANSTVRKILNISAETFDYQQSALISLVTLNRSHNHIGYERFTKEGSIAFLPRAGNTAGLVLCAKTSEIPAWLQLSDAQFLQKIQQTFGYRLGRFIACAPRVTYPLKLMKATQQIGEGFALVGNATHVLHPIAAQGFNLGLRDLKILSSEIAHAVAKEPHSLANLKLANFLKLRAQDQKQTISFTHQLIQFYAPNLWPLTFARNLATVIMGNLPFLKQKLTRQTLGIV